MQDFGALAASHQPPDAGEIKGAGEGAAYAGVFRPSGLARAVGDFDQGDIKAFAPDQGGQVAVHVVEERQRQENSARERLQAAAGIVGAITQDCGAQAVGDA